MKNFFSFLLAIALPVLLSGQSFEGAIHTTLAEKDGHTAQYLWQFKDSRLALQMTFQSDLGEHRMVLQLDYNKDQAELITFSPDGNCFYNLLSPDQIDETESLLSSRVQTTGKSDTFKGRSGQKYLINADQSQTVSWIDDSLNIPLYRFSRFLQNDHSVAALKQVQQEGFPIKSLTTGNDGIVLRSFELVEIKEQKLEESIFQRPANCSAWTYPGKK